MKKHPIIRKILEFRDKRDWKQFHTPKNLAISLAIEAAEVLETVQWKLDTELTLKEKLKLREELADVYYCLLLLANDSGIDLDEALEEKMIINEKKYPINKSKGSSKKYTEL